MVLIEGGSEQDYEEAVANENDATKQLHKTNSVFLNNLHPSIKRSELEDACRKFPGYMRLALSEPDVNNKFVRKCWISFERNTKIREICFGLNNIKIREHDLKPLVNKDWKIASCDDAISWGPGEIRCRFLLRTAAPLWGRLSPGSSRSALIMETTYRVPRLTKITDLEVRIHAFC